MRFKQIVAINSSIMSFTPFQYFINGLLSFRGRLDFYNLLQEPTYIMKAFFAYHRYIILSIVVHLHYSIEDIEENLVFLIFNSLLVYTHIILITLLYLSFFPATPGYFFVQKNGYLYT